MASPWMLREEGDELMRGGAGRARKTESEGRGGHSDAAGL